MGSLSPSVSVCLFLHRMIPPTSKNFLVNNLAAGTQYDLCVLAIYDDVITSLTATRVVGCVQFTTESEYMRCHFMQSQFLGGTMIIIIGGIIVASVLVFIIILMIRYKVCLSVLIYFANQNPSSLFCHYWWLPFCILPICICLYFSV
uniref:Fibronectin type-III domain-containing protein n=1 Tax=Myripristis murdjan TaxID=586833 RepID=A0A667Z9G0_9TELE